MMHEMSIAMNIVDIAVQTAQKNGAHKINSITVEIGALSGVVPEALEFCFEAATKETMAEGCRLEIVYLKAQAECSGCGFKFETDQFLNLCPQCGEQVFAAGGQQLQVKAINVD
ncbi:hydrogenase maturation nickel metallochaperone HypA [Caldithrix abyssi]